MSANEIASSTLYTHEPLNTERQQIRLLKLAKDCTGPLQCVVKIFDLDNAPSYSALSYRWGSPVTELEIFLDGRSFRVRENLFHFLQTFRREQEATYLWIDQICIAQSNVKERNHQVNLMSRIYSQCRSTIIWLCDAQGLYSRFAADFNTTGKSASLAPLIADPYFTRLWIVQEVLLSPHVRVLVSGNIWVSWDAMGDCFKTKGWKPTPAKALVLPQFGQEIRPSELSWYIRRFSSNGCEDARDKVFGLQGLVRPEKRLNVDYNKRPFEVWVDAVLACPIRKQFEVLWHLGEDMGIETADIVSLDSFLALILPNIRAPESKNTMLISSIGIHTDIKPIERKRPPVARRGKRERAEKPDIRPKVWIHSMDSENAFLNPRKSHSACNRCETFRMSGTEFNSSRGPWDIVEDIMNGQSIECGLEAQEKRWAMLEKRRQGPGYRSFPRVYVKRWYFSYGEKTYKYMCAPDWEAVCQLDPLLMKSIAERLCETALREQEARMAELAKKSLMLHRRRSY
ncbi:heterokaryon incompatibility protein-domain-containing protein [Boeremia exigua]|uniref:heterokaryon incompatibility protein-domain-containing protein n=1 Tax=Boeremia exigua TaxID=749465 RepID=UPI001E8DBD6F|nr:heterokaryon incompatibility protein-domain-containing protein [Boeremia exigua]KAH6642532.1 heterokaryon incompatibility protein-domain-containing protein [Boeremia exigua]